MIYELSGLVHLQKNSAVADVILIIEGKKMNSFLILKNRFLRVVIIALTAGFWVADVNATKLTVGCADINQSCTLQELVDGGSITINDHLFSDWLVDDASTIAVDVSEIDVFALDDQANNPSLLYQANTQLQTVGFNEIDLYFGFSVAALSMDAKISGNSLKIEQFIFGTNNIGGLVIITEDVLSANGFDLIDGKFVVADNLAPPFFELSDSAMFDSQSTIFIDNYIFITGDDTNDTVMLSAFSQRFSQVPEPATLGLMVAGLMGISFARRYRKRLFVNEVLL